MFDLALQIGLEIMEKFKPLVLPAGLVGTAYVTYLTMPKTMVRTKMLKIFKMGGLHVKKMSLGKEIEIYPVIRSVQFKEDSTIVVFSIPFGLDPEVVFKHEWLFRQQFGSNIELEQEGKKFTLTIRNSTLKEFNYSYSDIDKKLKTMRLPIVAGRSYDGYEIYDMVEHPHLLIAGETGSGKSTQLRSIITTLIKCMSPNKLHLYMADMKRSEFHIFRRIKHVQEVVTRANELYTMLLELKREMERRGDLLDAWELTHIDEYNQAAEDKKPYLVLCIDEVALLKKEQDCMNIIEDISSIGRALGVFLILSMQRPDADVLDGKLKNNLTVRMAFRHSDEINSRITIGSGEASKIKLSERGRMIFKHEELKEVQGAYLDLDKAKNLLAPYREPRKERKEMGEVKEEQQEKILGMLDDAS